MPDTRQVTIELASSPADFAAGAALILEYRREFYAILRLQNIDKELQEIEERYSPPNSRFFLLKEWDKVVACAILKRFSEDAVELKRMFITSKARGKGYGRLLLEHAIQNAKDLGFQRIILDTEPVMTTAIHLYEKFGFKKCAAYYNSPLPSGLFYELNLKTITPINQILMESYLPSVIKQFQYYKSLADKAILQVEEDEKLNWQPEPNSNSIAIIIKHLAGNMLSRWTDFLNSDGEKTWRNREAEFEGGYESREAMLEHWEKGWKCLFDAIEPLQTTDLERIIYIRNEGHTVLEAINRQLAHYPYHVGQIVYLARMLAGEHWRSLSIPKGGSEAFNAEKFAQEKQRKHFTDSFK